MYTDELRNGAWRTLVHGLILRNMEWAVILAKVRPEKADLCKDNVRKTMLFYANRYLEYSVHGVRAGKGRIMPQSLCEAIFMVSVGRYLQWIQDEECFNESDLEFIREKWFSPAVDLIKPQIGIIHNIHV